MDDLERKLRQLRSEVGYSNFDHAVKKLLRERLQVSKDDRGERRRYRPGEYKRLYHRQNGLCGICDGEMAMPKNWPGELEMDHIDPNSPDWDSEGNRQVVHGKCNREKSSKTPNQIAKESGRTVSQQVERSGMGDEELHA